jgi:two-component system response regulator HydG
MQRMTTPRTVLSEMGNAMVPAQLAKLDCEQGNVERATQRLRVLIADGDVDWAQELSSTLGQHGYACVVASSGEVALDIVRHRNCNVVICDTQIPGMAEFALLDQIMSIHPSLPVIVATASISMTKAVEAVKRGVFQCIEKPFHVNDLLGIIVQATDILQSFPCPSQPPPGFPTVPQSDLVQVSSAMRKLAESIALVARSNAPVLILGESGTGKERVARAIHAGSPRACQPFVPVNTSTIPEHLIESEVFGHVRGAFTGATESRRGLLLAAHGSTLLLDEIGDMPIALQPKLLRVLQFGETRALGSDQIGYVDVRVIATTQYNLDLLAYRGRFRKDLLYRLNAIPLVVPPLRERREDIPPLVERFLLEARKRTVTSPVIAICDEAMDKLIHAPWPGNVRELENAIERLVVLGREDVVSPRDLAFLDETAPKTIWSTVPSTRWTWSTMNQREQD